MFLSFTLYFVGVFVRSACGGGIAIEEEFILSQQRKHPRARVSDLPALDVDGYLPRQAASQISAVQTNAVMRKADITPATKDLQMSSQSKPIDVKWAGPVFVPQVHVCNQTEAADFNQMHKAANGREIASQRNTMQGLAEVMRIFKMLEVPLILMSGSLLGWRRGCMAITGDQDADVATFGPWLQEIGLQRLEEAFVGAGHSWESGMCPDGPSTVGCEFRVTLYGMPEALRTAGGTPYVDISMLFSAPASGQDGRGYFKLCDESICGSSCEKCNLAYGMWSGNLLGACPIPVERFELAAWMNQTFWVPANIEQYLVAEYGTTWWTPLNYSGYKYYKPCGKYLDGGINLPRYTSEVQHLPRRHDVMSQQVYAEFVDKSAILESAWFEASLWRAGGDHTAPWEFPTSEIQAASLPQVQLSQLWWSETHYVVRFQLLTCVLLLALAWTQQNCSNSKFNSAAYDHRGSSDLGDDI